MPATLTRRERRAWERLAREAELCQDRDCGHAEDVHRHYGHGRHCAIRGCRCKEYTAPPGRLAALLGRLTWPGG